MRQQLYIESRQRGKDGQKNYHGPAVQAGHAQGIPHEGGQHERDQRGHQNWWNASITGSASPLRIIGHYQMPRVSGSHKGQASPVKPFTPPVNSHMPDRARAADTA